MPVDNLDELNTRQAMFVLRYVELGVGKTAAIAAGYSKENSEAQASVLLADPKVSKAVEALRAKVQNDVGFEITRVCTELYRILTADIGEAIDPETQAFKKLTEWPEDVRRALSGVDNKELWENDGVGGRVKVGEVVKAKFWSKTEAANLLLKKLGGFAPERVEHHHSFAELVAKTQEIEE